MPGPFRVKRPHRLTIVDRGPQHRHRWAGECACGQWTMTGRRRVREIEDGYRDHVEAFTPGHRPPGLTCRDGKPTRRDPTPADRLPAELRGA